MLVLKQKPCNLHFEHCIFIDTGKIKDVFKNILNLQFPCTTWEISVGFESLPPFSYPTLLPLSQHQNVKEQLF